MRSYQSSLKFWMLTFSVLSTIGLSGCQSTQSAVNKFDNGSLDYQKTQQLPPIELPVDLKPAPFTPLYPIPRVAENRLDVTNDNRYKLPPPPRTTLSNIDKSQ